MSLKDELSQDQWEQIVQAPFVAGFAVTAADPGGLIGAFQESTAMAKALRSTEGAIAAAIMDEMRTSEGRGLIKAGLKALIKGRPPIEASEAAVTRLQETMSLISQKAPLEFDAMAALIRETAHNVAQAANEGGFMGFGGVPVSDAEKKTLADIEGAISAAQV